MEGTWNETRLLALVSGLTVMANGESQNTGEGSTDWRIGDRGNV